MEPEAVLTFSCAVQLTADPATSAAEIARLKTDLLSLVRESKIGSRYAPQASIDVVWHTLNQRRVAFRYQEGRPPGADD